MKINIVCCDDWEALYIDGVKSIEGHTLHVTQVLDSLVSNGVIAKYSLTDIEYTREEESGYVDFPKKLLND